MTDLAVLERRLEELAREAGEIIRSAGKDLGSRTKSNYKDFVTVYDKKVQDFLESHLKAEFPGIGYLAEEGDDFGNVDAERPLFVIDPIDGTTNFVRRMNCSAVSIGYAEHGKPTVGVVYAPFTDELFTAIRGQGAFCNGQPIRVNDDDLAHTILAFGTSVYYAELMEGTCRLFGELLPRVTDIRRSGSAAVDLCYTAAGRFGGFVEHRLCPWDYAAGQIILTEAGGLISDYHGNPLPLDKKPSVCCGNPKVYAELRAIVDKF